MTQTVGNPESKRSSKPLNIALVIVIILSLFLAGCTAFGPHVATIAQQQFVTTAQPLRSTSTSVNLETQTVTSVTTVTNTNLPAGYYQYCNSYSCSPYAAPPGYYDFGCSPSAPYSIANGNTVECSGYLYSDGSGCVDLLVPIDNGYSNNIQQYYYLENLPASHPPIGSWVTVSGQLYQQGNYRGPMGVCPSTYINVTSINTTALRLPHG